MASRISLEGGIVVGGLRVVKKFRVVGRLEVVRYIGKTGRSHLFQTTMNVHKQKQCFWERCVIQLGVWRFSVLQT